MPRCYVSEQIAKHCDEPDNDKCIGCRGLALASEIGEFGYCESCEYEADANADHVTEQIPNV